MFLFWDLEICKYVVNFFVVYEEKWWRKKEPDSNFKIKVDELLIARTAAKADRNFLKADLIRSQLKSAGVEVVDESNGVSNAVFTDNLDPDKLF